MQKLIGELGEEKWVNFVSAVRLGRRYEVVTVKPIQLSTLWKPPQPLFQTGELVKNSSTGHSTVLDSIHLSSFAWSANWLQFF